MKIDELEALLKEEKPLEKRVTPEEYRKQRREIWDTEIADVLDRYLRDYYKKFLCELNKIEKEDLDEK